MKVTVKPSVISGNIEAAASKSSMQRALAAALLARGETLIRRPGSSNDDLAALDVIQKLGAVVAKTGSGDLLITGKGVDPVSDTIHCGESGLGIRMFTPLAALSEKQLTITGTGSLITRPMDFFDQILPLAGVSIRSNNGKLPLHIQGPVRPANIRVDGSLSSQFLTGILMSFAAAGAKDVSVFVDNLTSRPYIDLTLDVLYKFGVKVENRNYEEFYFDNNNQGLTPADYTIEGDWSGAAFLLVAGAIAGSITVKGLDPDSTQADKAILQALKDSGAKMQVGKDEIQISQAALTSFRFDATDCPDLFPPLVALASYCNPTTVLKGVSRLTHKESNRALTLQEEFGKMGVPIRLEDDLMYIEGGAGLNGAGVHSHHDHRIAMACAVAALKATGETVIEEAFAINKSYPEFYKHLSQVGVTVIEH